MNAEGEKGRSSVEMEKIKRKEIVRMCICKRDWETETETEMKEWEREEVGKRGSKRGR